MGLIVLCYHHVSREKGITPEGFEENLVILKDSKWTPVKLSEIEDCGKGKFVHLTFDDGYDDIPDFVAPIVQKHGFYGTVFVITDRVGTPGYLSWDRLRELKKSGRFAIEAHGHMHNRHFVSSEPFRFNTGIHYQHDLDVIYGGHARIGYPLFTLRSDLYGNRFYPDEEMNSHMAAFAEEYGGKDFADSEGFQKRMFREYKNYIKTGKTGHSETDSERAERVKKDILTSKELVRENLGAGQDYFCYPRGEYDDRLPDIVAECGFKGAFTLDPGLNTEKNPFLIKRIDVKKGSLWFQSRLAIYSFKIPGMAYNSIKKIPADKIKNKFNKKRKNPKPGH
ncbi:MAG: polysaccharide deacetylase family protein [Elusimicrobiota bacterium]